MRKRIIELADGRLESAKPDLQIPREKIELKICENQIYQGEIELQNKNQVPVKGYITTNSNRMVLLNSHFSGEKVKFTYEFHSKGLLEGDIHKGDFYLICNQGEYNLSFVVYIKNAYSSSLVGPIDNLLDFSKLASEHWEEAKRIFFGTYFRTHLKKIDESAVLIYDALCKGYQRDQVLEEFLCTLRMKQKLEISPMQYQYNLLFTELSSELRIPIQKNTWGKFSLSIISEDPFLQVAKNRLQQEDFLGSVYELPIIIDAQKLHQGMNYGRISFVSTTISFDVYVFVKRTSQHIPNIKYNRIRKLHQDLLESYEKYRLQKISQSIWIIDSLESLKELSHLNSNQLWYLLFRSQLLSMNGQRQDASWCLEYLKKNIVDKKSVEWAMYLYITTFEDSDSAYLDKVIREIEEIGHGNETHTILFLINVFLNETLGKNAAKKLSTLHQFSESTKQNPVLLVIERNYLRVKDPFLIQRLDEKTVRDLLRLGKKGYLTVELSDRIKELRPENQGYHPLILKILFYCYQIQEDTDILAIILRMLIQEGMYQKKYFLWYKRGVEVKLKIKGLYEAYLFSLDPMDNCIIPRVIFMYFRYHSQLENNRKTILYRKIIEQKLIERVLYQQYTKQMELYVIEQLKQKNIDEHLAYIYEDILPRIRFNAELAQCFSQIVFTHHVRCYDKRIIYVKVYQKAMKHPQVYPMRNNTAKIQLFCKDYSIVLEDLEGNQYSSSMYYQLERLMSISKHVKQAMKYAPLQYEYLVYYVEQHPKEVLVGEAATNAIQCIMGNEDIDEEYKIKWSIEFFSHDIKEKDKIDYRMFIAQWKCDQFDQVVKRFYFELLLKQGYVNKAFAFILEAGTEHLDTEKLQALLTKKIESLHGENAKEIDDLLVAFMKETKLLPEILTYQQKYYFGTTKNQAIIIKHLKTNQQYFLDLEERLLSQIIFTGEFLEQTGELFTHYYTFGKNQSLKKAYLNYFAYQCFVYKCVAPRGLYLQLLNHIKQHNDLHIVAKLELLRYYANTKDYLTQNIETELLFVESILVEVIKEQLFFEFYQELPKDLVIKYQFDEHIYFQYQAQKKGKITLFYKKEGEKEYKQEILKAMLFNIYVKPFRIFADESLSYYVVEENESDITQSGKIFYQAMKNNLGHSRFERLNDFLEDNRNGLTNEEKKREYLLLDQYCKQEFPIIK